MLCAFYPQFEFCCQGIFKWTSISWPVKGLTNDWTTGFNTPAKTFATTYRHAAGPPSFPFIQWGLKALSLGVVFITMTTCCRIKCYFHYVSVFIVC